MVRRFFTIAIVSALLAVSSFARAESDEHGRHSPEHRPAETHHGINLPDDLRELLSAEMRAIQKGMEELVSAVASGAWSEIKRIAGSIEASYIMKQKLSNAQMEQLHHTLPPGFQALDRAFHETAGRLARAAERRDGQLANFYFYKLNESCVQCHRTYARERFPGFEPDSKGHHH